MPRNSHGAKVDCTNTVLLFEGTIMCAHFLPNRQEVSTIMVRILTLALFNPIKL